MFSQRKNPYCDLLRFEINVYFSNPKQLTMKKILGLDLGSTSIGWAFITEDVERSEILRLGVRLIPYTGDEQDEFSKGRAISLNKQRTHARTARKTNHRYKLRKKALTDELSALGMMPGEGLMLAVDPVTLYGLRARAASEQVTLTELGRILFLLNQKRGYRSTRSGAEDDGGKKLSDYLTELRERKELLERENLTIGQYFFSEYQRDRWFQTRKKVFPRECYIQEFDTIWRTQQPFYPGILTDATREKLRDTIIYYQRRLKSQKHLVGECRFEKHHKVTPRSSPLFQYEKIWESINSISIRNKANEPYDLNLEQKQKVFDHLISHDKLNLSDLMKIVGLNWRQGWTANEQIRKAGLQGDTTRNPLRKALSKAGIKDTQEWLRFDILETRIETNTDTGEVTEHLAIRSDFEKEPLYVLWHLLYSVDEPERLIPALMRKFGFSKETADILSDIDFKKDGFGNKSARAIRKLLPGLLKGMVYSEAAEHVGYNHSDSITTEENLSRELKNALERYPRNALRQPVVEKILNQLVNLVNGILQDETLGRPDEIRVELARELRQSREEREKTYKRNNESDRAHQEIVARLTQEFPGLSVTRKVIEKYKLYEQQGKRCMYSGQTLTLAQVLLGEGVDVDHIIPQSKLFDDSFQNKVLALRVENALKDNETAFDYMSSRSKDELDDFLERVNLLFADGMITRAKRDRLLMKEHDIPEDFINRQLNETRYISRESMRLLKQVSRNVFATSGSVTDFLRSQWGYNEVLKQLNRPVYEAVGMVTDGKIEGWSKRDDHRHHAIDALIVACTRQSFIQQLNTLNSRITREHLNQVVKTRMSNGWQARKSLLEQYIQTQQPFHTDTVKQVVAGILISQKPGKKVVTVSRNVVRGKTQLTLTPRGQLHKEQVYGRIRRYSEKKTPLNGRFTDTERIANPHIRKIVADRLAAYGNDPKKAFKDLDKNPLWTDAAHSKALTEVTLWEDFFVFRYSLDMSFKEKDIKHIIDKQVREKVQERFDERAGHKEHPLKNLTQDPIWLNREKGIRITSVRCFTGLNDLVPLHGTLDGKTGTPKTITPLARPVDFVSTRNNHHIALYESPEGKWQECVVTLWQAVERKKVGLPVIVENPSAVWDMILSKGFENQDLLKGLPQPEWRFITSLQQNEMFVFGMEKSQLIAVLNMSKFPEVSKRLYRVQKLSTRDYYFRHQYETRLEKNPEEGGQFASLGKMMRIKNLSKLATLNPIKVRIDTLGRIFLA
jgi:CRISPR-associated endonuclease Csn1